MYRGHESPIFLQVAMITKEQIIEIVEEKTGDDLFLVDVTVSSENEIVVVIDGDNGVNIKRCIEISRHVEGSLDRDTEDFKLDVLSFGLEEAFKLPRQYKKNIGREINVLTDDSKEIKGLLREADNNGIVLEEHRKEKIEGKKKKELVVYTYELSYEQIKSAKNVISFK